MIDKRPAIWKRYNEKILAREEADRWRNVARDVEWSFKLSFRPISWFGVSRPARGQLILERKEKRNRAWRYYYTKELAVRFGL